MSAPIMKLAYQGSVKNVYGDSQDPHVNYFAFTDDYSIFDWGKMPDAIQNKGKSLSILGGFFFNHLASPKSWQDLVNSQALKPFSPEFLQGLFESEAAKALLQSGMNSHFLGWIHPETGESLSLSDMASLEPAPLMKVQAIEVHRPERIVLDHQVGYDYSRPALQNQHIDVPRLIPLEVIFRFGMPEGSSLQQRLDNIPDYAQTLGLSEIPEANQYFERPVLEFFTKLESTDRFLSSQEALLLSGLNAQLFHRLYDTALLLALWLFNCFHQCPIELWDGKFEFAIGPNGIILVDSIGPDELRLKHRGVHLSKEAIRQFYRGSTWEKALKEAKAKSLLNPHADWKALCIDYMQTLPAPLSPKGKAWVDNLYGAIANTVIGTPIIPQSRTLADLIQELPAITSEGALAR